jgi:hypothetical protein
MTDSDYLHAIEYLHAFARDGIENLKVAISVTSDEDRKAELYAQLGDYFAASIQLSALRLQATVDDLGLLECSVGEQPPYDPPN